MNRRYTGKQSVIRARSSITCLAALVLFLLANGPPCLAGNLGIRMVASPGHVEVFFEAVSTNDYQLRKGDSLTNLLTAEVISEASGTVRREYPITGSAEFFALEQTPVTPPLEGFGEISGRAFVLDEELTNSLPSYFSNTLDFAANPFDPGVDDSLLTPGGRAILDSDPGGGSAHLSKVFAFEVLARAEGAALLKTGPEIIYNDPSGKKATFLVEIKGVKIGVTVTRAVTYQPGAPYTSQMAESLLAGQLSDILSSSANVSSADAWAKQILSIIAYDPSYVEVLRTAWDNMAAAAKSDTILYLTATHGDDSFLY